MKKTAAPRSHRLHKPVVVGSSPTAATFVSLCHTENDAYHRWPEVSCSQLKELRHSPLSFYLRHVSKETPPKSSSSLAYGTLLHLWAEVGHEAFWDRVEVAPESACTASGLLSATRGEAWAKTLPETRIPVSIAEAEQLRLQTRQILRNKAARKLLESSIDREFNIKWNWGGHNCRCRVDGATDWCLYDLKTTRDKHPLKTFWKSVEEWGYHLQAAYYGVAAVAAGLNPQMQFICTSNVYPHHCEVAYLPERLVRQAEEECFALLEELKSRREWDVWEPTTYGEVHELWVPQHLYRRRAR